MPGPPKKPTNIKAIRGTVRPDRVPEGGIEAPTLDEMPEVPDWLPNIHAVKEWEKLGPVLIGLKLLTVHNLGPFAQLCALQGKIVQLWSAGETPTGHMLSQYIKLVQEFGMTPASQSRVKATDSDGKSGNKFTDGGPKRKKS